MDISILESHRQWPLAIKIDSRLKSQGFQSYLAGGCVRDLILGVKPKDIDIATNAPPEKILSLFPKTIEVGQAFGVVRVVEDNEVIEVATFRKDGLYKDGRRPEQVTYSDPENDAERRDFTINALFFDLSKKQIIDYVGGQKDLQKKIIKTVGDPYKRFEEDHLRLLRAIRFSAQLAFEIEDRTWSALKEQSYLISSVSEERVREEILKLLSSNCALKGLALFKDSGLLQCLYPLLNQSIDKGLSYWKKLEMFRYAQPWIYFFWPLMENSENWDEFLKTAEKLKLTRDEKKSLRVAFFFLRLRNNWAKSRWGEKLIFYASKEGSFLLHMQAHIDETWQNELNETEEEFLKVSEQGQLPKPFLQGQDVMHLEGKSRGDKLHEAYVLQLEGALKSREDAVSWVRS